MAIFKPYKIVIYCLYGCLMGLLPLQAKAQVTGEWIGAQLEIDLPNSFTAVFEGEARYNNLNGIFTNKYLVDAGIDYKINNRWDLGATYRYSYMREDNEYFYGRHRLSMDVDYDNSFGNIGYSYRMRFQREYRTYIEDAFDAIPENEWRHRFQIEYDINNNPIDPYLEHEIFLPLNRYLPFRFMQRRWTAGIQYPLANNHDIDIGLMYEKELYPRIARIFNLLISYSFSIN